MNYHYRAVNSDGGIVTGTVAAENERTASRLLRVRGLTPVDIKSRIDSISEKRLKKPGSGETHSFMHQLCTLLESGVCLEEAVEALAESPGHPFLAREFAGIGAALRRGVSFSKALKDCRIRLPGYFHPLAEAGELSGKIANAMRDGITQMEYDIETANELRNALIYPVILVLAGMGAIILIFTSVVPKFVKLIDKTQGHVPFLARLVLESGRFFNENVFWIGPAATGTLIFACYACFNEDMRVKMKNFLVRLPVLKDWIMESEIAKWSAMMSTLLENRVSLPESMKLAQDYVTTASLKARLAHVSVSVRNGASLSSSLQDMGAVTPAGHNLVRVGERSGELPRMLASLSSLHTRAGRDRMKRFLAVLEPAAILMIGTMIGFIMAGIILAITSANNVNIQGGV